MGDGHMGDGHNPFKPPVTSAAPPPNLGVDSREVPAFDASELEQARQRLREHCADAAALEADRAAEGSLLRVPTIVFLVLALVSFAALAATVVLHARIGIIFAVIGAILFGLVALSLLIVDLTVGRRQNATDPIAALKGWLRAAKASHAGYVFTALAPTAREGVVAAPALGGPSELTERFATDNKADLKRYLKSWARPDNKSVRWTRIKKIERLDDAMVSGSPVDRAPFRAGQHPANDVARVRMQLELTAWPQWANILSVIAFVFIRIVGIVLAIALYYSLRKVRKLESIKTVMRGDDGLWYVLDADLRR